MKMQQAPNSAAQIATAPTSAAAEGRVAPTTNSRNAPPADDASFICCSDDKTLLQLTPR
jgi:hypothetical protein